MEKQEIESIIREYIAEDPDGLIAYRIRAMIDKRLEEVI